MLFPKGKTKFIRPDGSIGRAPGHGIVLLGMGETANAALRRSELGLFVVLRRPDLAGGACWCVPQKDVCLTANWTLGRVG
jgi:hypothetical protein